MQKYLDLNTTKTLMIFLYKNSKVGYRIEIIIILANKV